MSNKLEEARKIINEIDTEMAKLFVGRMKAVEEISQYKKELGLPVFDQKREEELLKKSSALIEDEALKKYYTDYLNNLMSLSRSYQYSMQSGSANKTTIRMNLGSHSYDILVERGLLDSAKEHLNLDRKVFILTDSGVPKEYAERLLKQAKEGFIYKVQMGEASKSLEVLEKLLEKMLEEGLSRKDCVVAVGGGVVGDLAGFAAAIYMRGIDFYNIPTTLLSMLDSSIGGKTAVNFGGVKNVIGAFYQPKKVLIDPNLLKTLPKRQISNGMAEAIKMSLTSENELFEIFHSGSIEENLDEIIVRSLNIKKNVVEADEKEAGLRKVLNFGHTVGHGIEVTSELYHGECVALGMLPFLDDAIRPRVIEVLKKCDLYKETDYDWDKIERAIAHDKKADGKKISVILVNEIGNFEIKEMKIGEIISKAKEVLK